MIWHRHYIVWVFFLLSLAFVSIYLLQMANNHKNPDETSRFAPDIKATNIHLLATNQHGAMKYVIQAKQLTHYQQGNYSFFNQPVITISQNDKQELWKITADTGEAYRGIEEIRLQGQVMARQADVVIETDNITVNQKTDQANTDEHVTVYTPESTLEADGLHVLLSTQYITLLKNVRGVHALQPNS